MYLIKSKRFKNWSNKTKNSLLNMTLPTGSMKPLIINQPSTTTYVCYNSHRNILYGWLAYGNVKTDNMTLKYDKAIVLFVKKQYRKKGIGKLLVRECLKDVSDKVIAFPWDLTSENFWNSMKKEFSNLEMMNAYSYYIRYGNLQNNWKA